MNNTLSSIRLLGLTIAVVALTGCATAYHPLATDTAADPPWLRDILEYHQQITPEHPDSLDALFTVSSEMRQLVLSKFGHLPKHTAADRLARWLIDEDGHAMVYDLTADFSPIDAFRERRGNCLSYTLLLNSLAAELDINLQYNDVRIPAVWDMNLDRELTFYRHINSIYRHVKRQSVFDLAIEEFSFGYPSRNITRELAAAMLHSNRAVHHLRNDRSDAALHAISLAISIAPGESAFWVNLGVILQRTGRTARAETSFLQALRVDSNNALAASQLEKLYLVQDKPESASKYSRLAKRAQRTNPYFHYKNAQDAFQKGELKAARKSIDTAKRLHRSDPRFYELSSLISQRQRQYSTALLDLRRAMQLSVDELDKRRYAHKVEMVSKMVKARVNNDETRRNYGGLLYVDGT